jgi:hypothetical protein
MIKVEFKGDIGAVKGAAEALKKKPAEMSMEIAKAYKRRLRKNISQQLLPMAPLDRAYAAKKASKGLDPRILVATKEYLDSFQVVQEGTSASVSSGNVHAQALEFGNAQQPARPHWMPTMMEMEQPAILHPLIRRIIAKIFGDK